MCPIATSLVTSIEINPIGCATTLCIFGQKWNGYEATRSFLLSSTAESTATSGYVVVPQSFGQNEESTSRIEERTKKTQFCSQQWIQLVQYVNTCENEFFPSSLFFVFCILLDFRPILLIFSYA